MELPLDLFAIFKKYFSILKGAILLYDNEQDVFAPWSSSGYDLTTTNRLRFPKNMILQNINLTAEKPVIIKDNLKLFNPYFSLREYSVIEVICICPFVFNSDLIALLIITDSPSLYNKNILSLLTEIKNISSSLLYNSRIKKLNKLGQSNLIKKPDVFDKFNSIIETAEKQDKKLTFFSIDIDEMVHSISSESIDADQFRIRTDIIKVLSSIVEGIGNAITVDNKKLIIIISSKSLYNDKLLANQIKIALSGFFQSRNEFPLNYSMRSYPDNGKSAVQLLQELF